MCNRTEDSPLGNHNSWQEIRGAVELLETKKVPEKSEQGADSGKGAQEGFPQEVASRGLVCLTLISPCASLVLACDSTLYCP